MRYVEEDDQYREECAGEGDEDDESELGEVRQCRDPQLGSARGEEAGQAGHRCHLQKEMLAHGFMILYNISCCEAIDPYWSITLSVYIRLYVVKRTILVICIVDDKEGGF